MNNILKKSIIQSKFIIFRFREALFSLSKFQKLGLGLMSFSIILLITGGIFYYHPATSQRHVDNNKTIVSQTDSNQSQTVATAPVTNTPVSQPINQTNASQAPTKSVTKVSNSTNKNSGGGLSFVAPAFPTASQAAPVYGTSTQDLRANEITNEITGPATLIQIKADKEWVYYGDTITLRIPAGTNNSVHNVVWSGDGVFSNPVISDTQATVSWTPQLNANVFFSTVKADLTWSDNSTHTFTQSIGVYPDPFYVAGLDKIRLMLGGVSGGLGARFYFYNVAGSKINPPDLISGTWFDAYKTIGADINITKTNGDLVYSKHYPLSAIGTEFGSYGEQYFYVSTDETQYKNLTDSDYTTMIQGYPAPVVTLKVQIKLQTVHQGLLVQNATLYENSMFTFATWTYE